MTSYNSPFTGQVIQPTDVSYNNISMSTSTQLQWPSNGSPLLTYAARIMEVTASTSGLALIMPPANQASVGQDAFIRNLGSNSFTVQNYDLGTIITIAPGAVEYIYITSNTTTAGVWGIVAFGAGVASPDAATLAGYGLKAISSTLNQTHPVSAAIAGTTLQSSDRAQAKVWTGGSGTVNLPTAASLGNDWFCLFKNNGTGTVTIACSGSDLIDGVSTLNFQLNNSAFIISTGSGFVTVGYGQSNLFLFAAFTQTLVTGTYTLTAIQAANLIQEYSGSLTGNVTVIYPPVVNLYVISNQVTANGYTVTISTGVSGSNSVNIPAGAQATVFCDGTSFYNANTVQVGASSFGIIDGTSTTPSINFSSEPTTGIYRPGPNSFGISISGTLRLNVNNLGITVNGTGTFTGGVAGGAF